MAKRFLIEIQVRRWLSRKINNFISVRIELAGGLNYLRLQEYPWIPFSLTATIFDAYISSSKFWNKTTQKPSSKTRRGNVAQNVFLKPPGNQFGSSCVVRKRKSQRGELELLVIAVVPISPMLSSVHQNRPSKSKIIFHICRVVKLHENPRKKPRLRHTWTTTPKSGTLVIVEHAKFDFLLQMDYLQLDFGARMVNDIVQGRTQLSKSRDINRKIALELVCRIRSFENLPRQYMYSTFTSFGSWLV